MSLGPVLFALAMWFLGTGAVVWLDSRPRTPVRTSHRLGGIVALAAAAAIWATRSDAGASGAYVGFAAAVVIWGWHEMGFLMGFVAGPNRAPLPEGTTGWRRFRLATATVIHHELALAATVLGLFALTWGQPTQAAPLTFLLLFVLRLSAKFNLFLGIPNLSDEIFPAHLAYLKSYFRTRAFNPLFPLSLALAAGLATWAARAANAAADGSGTATTATLLATLAGLGFIEHLLLVLPFRDGAMWRWAMSRAQAAKPAATNI